MLREIAVVTRVEVWMQGGGCIRCNSYTESKKADTFSSVRPISVETRNTARPFARLNMRVAGINESLFRQRVLGRSVFGSAWGRGLGSTGWRWKDQWYGKSQ